MDDKQLMQMAAEVAAVLARHLPAEKAVELSGDSARLKSQTCVQISGTDLARRAIFSLNAVLLRSSPSSIQSSG